MVKNTPIRLIAMDEEPPDEDTTKRHALLTDDPTPSPDEDEELEALEEEVTPVQNAAPARHILEHEAITRRVPAVASQVPQAPKWPRPNHAWRRYIPIIIALVPVGALSMAWFLSRPARTPENAASPASNRNQVSPSSPAAPSAALPLAPTPSLPTPQGANAPDVIRLQVTVEPIQAEVGLDGNVLAGHRLNLEVPKDRSIHVVSATAPGYYPFNQQVSFSKDVVLNISLRRAHAGGRAVSRQRPSVEVKTPVVIKNIPAPPPVESKPQSTGKRSASPRLEPGMDLDTPAPRHSAKPIDERNPYRP